MEPTTQPNSYRDVVTSHLREDLRIQASVLAMRRVFQHSFYDIYLCVYSGLLQSISLNDDLVTCLVVFKRENLRAMFKLWATPIEGNRSLYLAVALKRLQEEGRGPLQLVRDAKFWVGLPFTSEDIAALRMAGVEIPIRPTLF